MRRIEDQAMKAKAGNTAGWPQGIGQSLRSWRAVRRMKQSHIADLLGCSQATISRWESGIQAPSSREAAAILRLLAARLCSSGDCALERLVRSSMAELHLICDVTHRLLAASPAREANWRVSATELAGGSMLRFASPEIGRAELGLRDNGWFAEPSASVEVATGANGRSDVPIRPGRFRWTRMRLSDGSFARLVETLPFASVNVAAPSSF
jgi:transcriptional regulator with XRE-family HTH domain